MLLHDVPNTPILSDTSSEKVDTPHTTVATLSTLISGRRLTNIAMEPRIQVVTHYIPSAELGLPALAVQITRLVGTYMVWVGTTDGEPEEVQNAPTQGYLGKDWACAMPPSESVSYSTRSSCDGVVDVYVPLLPWCPPVYLPTV